MALKKIKVPLAAFQEAGDDLNVPELNDLFNGGYDYKFNMMIAEQTILGAPPNQYVLCVVHKRDAAVDETPMLTGTPFIVHKSVRD